MSSRSSSETEERSRNPPRSRSSGVTPRLTTLAAVATPPVGTVPLLAAVPSLVAGLTVNVSLTASPEVVAGEEEREESLYSEEGALENEVDWEDIPVFGPNRKVNFSRDSLQSTTEAATCLLRGFPASVPG